MGDWPKTRPKLAVKDLEKKGWTVKYERIPAGGVSASSQEEAFLAAEPKNPDAFIALTSSNVFIPVGPKVAATDLPILIYDIPIRTGRKVSNEVMLRLARDVPNVVAVKDASGDLAGASALIAQAPSGFEHYSGDDVLTSSGVVKSDTRDYYNDAGQLVAEDRYFNLPSTWTNSMVATRAAASSCPLRWRSTYVRAACLTEPAALEDCAHSTNSEARIRAALARPYR